MYSSIVVIIIIIIFGLVLHIYWPSFCYIYFFSDKLGAQRTLTGSEIYQTNHVPHGNISLFIVIVFLC